MLTPLDVKRQQFTKQKLGGYDPEQVHAFLERVATELETEKEKQRALENRAAELEKKLEHYERVELALQEALETARETARVAQEAAEKRARVTLDEAELRAQAIVRDAETERHSLRQDLTRITSRQKEVAAKMRAFLLSELELLATFEGDDPVGFLKLETSSSGARQLHLHSGDDEPEDEEDMTMELFDDEESDVDGEHPVASQAVSSSEGGRAATPTEDAPTLEQSEPKSDDAEIDWEAVSGAGVRAESDEEGRDAEGVAADDVEEGSDEPAISGRPQRDEAPVGSPSVAEDGEQPMADSEAWNLGTLVHGEEDASESDTDRERIRRILEDLD